MVESRTTKSLRNSTVALVFFAIEFILKFFSRKIFLDYLGTEILGLNTTANNILQFLNLAELGIGAAVGFSLYKPIFDEDKETIKEIVALQGHLYRRIATWIIIGSCVVMCFFPLIFHKMQLPLWYAYASFGVLLLSALISYFVNYKSILLSAAQQDYKIQYATRSWSITMVVCQMLAMMYFSHPYEWWLALQAVFTIIMALNLNRVIYKNYPWLTNISTGYKELKGKYSLILTKVKQVFFHKLGGFALTQTSPLIIYAYLSLTVVALYGNYMVIILGLTSLCNSVFNSIGAGVGNLIAEGDENKIWKVFKELFSVRFFIAAIMAWGLITLSQPFIKHWIGLEYLLPLSTVILLACQLFITVSRLTVENFVYAYGLYHDIWAPVIEAAINVGFSVLFGYFYGLNGILGGVLLSQIIVVLCWKPYFLFSRAMKRTVRSYIFIYFKHLIIFFLGAALSVFLLQRLPDMYNSWSNLIISGTLNIFIFSIIMGGLLVLSHSGLDMFFKRFLILRRSGSVTH